MYIVTLFNLYAEYIMRNARLDDSQAGIKIGTRNICGWSASQEGKAKRISTLQFYKFLKPTSDYCAPEEAEKVRKVIAFCL